MQYEPDLSDVRHGYVLAPWLQRLAAHVIDRLLACGAIFIGLLGLAVRIIDWLDDPYERDPFLHDGWLRDFVSSGVGEWLIFTGAALLLVYAVWFLFTLRNGQTPGKQMVGIHVIRTNGEPSGWTDTFIREFVLEWLAVGFLSGITGGIFYAVNYLWPLWDKDKQALHDKLAETLVVLDRPVSSSD